MAKMKILHVLTFSSWGGAPQVVYDIVKHLDAKKFSVTIACGAGAEWERMKECGATVVPLRFLRRRPSPVNDLRTLLELYLLMRRGGYDVVHCHSSKAGLLGRIAAKLAGVKKVYFTAHGWGLYNQREYGWAKLVMMASERVVAKWSSRIVCVSESVKQDAIRWRIAERDRFVVIKNGVTWLPQASREEVRQRLNATHDTVLLGMVGRLAYPKEPLLFLQVARRIVAQFQKAKFVLIGGGPLADECAKYVEENRLEDRVLLLGERPPHEVKSLLLALDAFVLASKFEGLPLTIIEAMFAGLPVIASNVGGVSELVHGNGNGLLFGAGNVHELTERIAYLIQNPQERMRMACAGRTMAHAYLTARRMAHQYECLYLDDVLEPTEQEQVCLHLPADR